MKLPEIKTSNYLIGRRVLLLYQSSKIDFGPTDQRLVSIDVESTDATQI